MLKVALFPNPRNNWLHFDMFKLGQGDRSMSVVVLQFQTIAYFPSALAESKLSQRQIPPLHR